MLYQKNRQISLRRFLYPVLLFLVAGAVIMHFAEGKRIWQLLHQSYWWWVALAVFLQLLFLFNQSALYKASYRLVGIPERFGYLFILVLANSFAAVALPGGTLSGVGLMVYDAARRGLNTSRAVMANLIFFLLDYMAFLIVLTAALFYLFSQGALQKYQLTATTILATVMLTSFLVLAWTAKNPVTVTNLGAKIIGLLPTRRKTVWVEKYTGFFTHLAEALTTLRTDKTALCRGGLHALLVEVIGLIQLETLFLAFRSHPSPGQLITGYAVGVLFMIVSITPSGLGIMEGAMTAAYVSVGISPETAIVVTFTYRALGFWLPVIAGFFVVRRLFRD